MNKSFKQKSGIYKIRNLINNKIYIGSSINVSVRISQHKLQLKNKKHHNKYLQSSVNKYGIENFEYSILEYCNENELLEREEYYINYYNSNNNNFGYNIESFINGRKRHSEETKKKIGIKNTGKSRILTNEWKENISKSIKGRVNSKEHNKNIRKSKLGKKRKPFSDNWINNLRKSHIKYSITIMLNNNIIKENLTAQECANFLNVQVRTIYQALKFNYKCNGYNIIDKQLTLF